MLYEKISKEIAEQARSHTYENKQELKNSDTCGCWYCRNIYEPNEIVDWADDGETALCPKCGIDAVIGDKSGFEINVDLLRAMKRKR